MSNIRLITDSTAYLERSYAQTHGVEIVPLSVHFEGTTEEEGFPGEFGEFFGRLANSSDFPTTSQPSVGAFQKVYEPILERGEEIIVLTLSSQLSGTYNSATTAASLTSPDKISVIDTLTAAANTRILIELALEQIAQGKTRAEIVALLETEKHKMGIRLTVGTLEYLKKGGRLSNRDAFIGSLLNIKPIIAMEAGKLVPVAKVRGRRKAIEKLMEAVPDTVTHLFIAQIDAYEEASELRELLQKTYPTAHIGICELGPVVGAHLGPQALGLLYKYA